MNLNKYEIARILGARVLQLVAGAPPLIEIPPNPTAIMIAELELKSGVMPLVVIREEKKLAIPAVA
ncbi:MAG TPA: DNA-directed RNA polymerase subunit K [Candidatus Micrarchaeota archaeon]|nr:DNA-directed RNA polymerase subunit K [Candidatus Micrarchaeota archaeon]